jgi:hypothetical protein
MSTNKIFEIQKPKDTKERSQSELLGLLVGSEPLRPEGLQALIRSMDNVEVVAKVFLLEGVPFVFSRVR